MCTCIKIENMHMYISVYAHIRKLYGNNVVWDEIMQFKLFVSLSAVLPY